MEKDEKREIRMVSVPVTVTGDGDKRTVEGYAALIGVSSDRLDFEERIEPGAFDGVIERSDVLALLNHSAMRGILARCVKGVGSLRLEVDSKGLRYSFDAPRTALGDELLENIRRGEVTESSFAFDVEGDTWIRKDDGTWKRSISRIGYLYDVSPVYSAAYSQTSVYLRGRDKAEEELRRSEPIPETYYENLERSVY